jgi:hypothetical protein
LTQSAGSLARTFGPALAGFLYTGIDFWAPFVVGGALMIPIVVLLQRLDVSLLSTGEDVAPTEPGPN